MLHQSLPDSVLQRVPDRSTPCGQLINSYLTKEAAFPDQSIHLLFSANRWELAESIKSNLNSGKTVILDRYVVSDCAYTIAKGFDPNWCLSPDIGLPKPDITIYMKLSALEAAKRGEFGNEIYETSEF